MAAKQHFLQDRTALLLVSGLAFLTLLTVILILLKLGGGQGTGDYIVSYRTSLGINRYTTGTVRDILSLIVAAVMIFATSLTIAYRSYRIRRELSLTVLALTIPLLIFLMVVSYLLLALR